MLSKRKHKIMLIKISNKIMRVKSDHKIMHIKKGIFAQIIYTINKIFIGRSNSIKHFIW